jgi:hypothetical protein
MTFQLKYTEINSLRINMMTVITIKDKIIINYRIPNKIRIFKKIEWYQPNILIIIPIQTINIFIIPFQIENH